MLTEAAIKGKVDPLLGLKENVIIGRLIHRLAEALRRYKNIELEEGDQIYSRGQALFA